MRRSARTDLCGGRPAMVVPTASTGSAANFAIVGVIKSRYALRRLSHLENGKAHLLFRKWAFPNALRQNPYLAGYGCF
jgi:hypothetical protein